MRARVSAVVALELRLQSREVVDTLHRYRFFPRYIQVHIHHVIICDVRVRVRIRMRRVGVRAVLRCAALRCSSAGRAAAMSCDREEGKRYRHNHSGASQTYRQSIVSAMIAITHALSDSSAAAVVGGSDAVQRRRRPSRMHKE